MREKKQHAAMSHYSNYWHSVHWFTVSWCLALNLCSTLDVQLSILWHVPARSNDWYHAGGNGSNCIYIQQFSSDVWQNGRVNLLFQSAPPLYTNTGHKSALAWLQFIWNLLFQKSRQKKSGGAHQVNHSQSMLWNFLCVCKSNITSNFTQNL